MDYLQMTAPCGLDCFNCFMYLAGEDEQLRQRIVDQLGLSPEAAQCPGCRALKGVMAQFGFDQPCWVYECCQEKGLDLCSQCDDFPCDRLQPFSDGAEVFPHNIKVYNLSLIKKLGLEEWARNKAVQVRRRYFGDFFHAMGPPETDPAKQAMAKAKRKALKGLLDFTP